MWSDTFLAIERAHFFRVGAWGAACVLVGTLLLAALAARRVASPLVRHFALQTALWGAVDLALAALAIGRLSAVPDYHTATRFDHFVWFSLGIDIGGAAVGVAIAVAGWLLGRRLGAVGAGLGVLVQGTALVALDLVVIAQIGSSL
jgi:hypothetical protein